MRVPRVPHPSQLLKDLHKDTLGRPLDPKQLALAVWVLQELASAATAGALALAQRQRGAAQAPVVPFDAGLPVPGADSALAPAPSLVFDDAPWLEEDAKGCWAGAERPLLVHPVISNQVAEASGCRSLRRALLSGSAAALDLTLAGSEAFGQHEVLTSRLRRIIDDYADGPGILSELLQNADDAGATEVRFLIDESTHGSGSLLGGNMADWQGPALLVYNDSKFSPADFAAIARIGQDSKVSSAHHRAVLVKG